MNKRIKSLSAFHRGNGEVPILDDMDLFDDLGSYGPASLKHPDFF